MDGSCSPIYQVRASCDYFTTYSELASSNLAAIFLRSNAGVTGAEKAQLLERPS
jgi:hypothetical protein